MTHTASQYVASLPKPPAVSTIFRRPQVQFETGLSRSAVYQRVQDGLFPHPVKLGLRASGWPAREVAAINEARIAGWSDARIRALVLELVAQRTAGGGR